MPSVLFLVANKTALGAVDQNIYDVLAAASWSITLQSFSLAANSDATGLDVVLVSNQGNSLPISGLFYDQAVPIVCIERVFGDTWNFGTAADRSGSSQTDTAIVDNSHYITDGLSVADLAVASPAVRMNYVTGTGTGAEILSEIVSGDSRAGDASLVVYEQGAAMANGATAPERRVYTWFTGDGNLNAAGEALFIRCMDWAAYNTGGGSHSLTANALTSGSSVESPAITQAQSLTATALNSASSVERPAITQAHGLTASALASASLVDSPALTQVHDLTGNSLTSASSVGTPILTTVPGSHTLTADSLDSASSVDSPALTQVHGLTATALDSATLLDSPALTQAHILAATALASATSTGSPALGLTSVLAANGLTSASLVGSPALSQVHALSADSLAVATIVDSATLLGGGYSVTVTGGRISNKAIGSRISNKVLGSKIKDLEI